MEAETQRAEAEKLRAETRKLISETESFRLGEYIKWFLGALGLATPFGVAGWQLKKQAQNQMNAQKAQADLDRESQQQQAKVQAQLKAIEIAMGSQTSGGVKSRLNVLKRAMPELLKDMPEELDLKGIGFASYKEYLFSS